MKEEEAGEKPGERELEELLRRAQRPQPDALFREELRAAFLGAAGEGASRAAGPVRMGAVFGAPLEDEFTAWLAARARLAPARAEFRSRLRAAFLSFVATDAPVRVRPPRSLQIVVLTLAAAAILAVTFLLPQPTHWSVRLEGPLELAGVEYAPGDEAHLAVELEGGGEVQTRGARAHLSLGTLNLELLPDARLELPPLPELDGVSTVAFGLPAGEAYLRTAQGYPGNPIVIHTPLAEVSLHGTTLGVLVNEDCLCVCVADGTVGVASERLTNWHQDVGTRWSLQLYSAQEKQSRASEFPAPGSEDAHVKGLLDFFAEP